MHIRHERLYRLPWNMADNPISWLEPTKNCNLTCFGCYSANRKDSHKSMAEIEREIDLFLTLRNSDGISIAGGDPLTHPKICDIVSMIVRKGAKPIINTNGLALTPELLRGLKSAGVAGFTFHIDSKQQRPMWKGKSELEINQLRQQYADMLAAEGGMSCAFNATIYGDTLHMVPGMLAWARSNIDRVHVMVFILFRAATSPERFDYYVRGKKIDVRETVYGNEQGERIDLSAHDLYRTVKTAYPEFEPCAYLNGTSDPASFKWTLSGWIGTQDRIFGCVGKRYMEVAQMIHHFWKKKYLAYTRPTIHRRGRLMLLLSVVDGSIRGVARRWLRWVCVNPLRLLQRLYYQSVVFIQPVDLLENGAQNMCDSCPDMTIHQGKLVWSCRLEEQLQYGDWAITVPKGAQAPAQGQSPHTPEN
ncbi:MAG: radical SAM protein [Deltaproteobacteria bacterium]|nr:radical SAM protein [Deltaproteobacteria bacterium]